MTKLLIARNAEEFDAQYANGDVLFDINNEIAMQAPLIKAVTSVDAKAELWAAYDFMGKTVWTDTIAILKGDNK